MAEAKHTPGPWLLIGDQVCGGVGIEPCVVAEPLGDTPEQATANGHLIAAAPDLLEALKTIARGNALVAFHGEIAQNIARAALFEAGEA